MPAQVSRDWTDKLHFLDTPTEIAILFGVMHRLQQKLYELIGVRGLRHFESLRELARMIGERHPQKIKHHLSHLEKSGKIRVNWEKNTVELTNIEEKESQNNPGSFFAIPVLGAANCGAATLVAEERPEGVLVVSKNMVPQRDKLFAVKAVGDSMDQATIRGKKGIEEGDYIVVDPKDQSPKSGDYVLSIINGSANVKKFYLDENNHQIILYSESSKDYPPIFIHETDSHDFLVNGKVVDVIKNPKMKENTPFHTETMCNG